MGVSLLAFGRMILVLVFIIGLIVLMARFGQKFQSGVGLRSRMRPSNGIEVLSRRSVGKRTSLVVISVANKTFLVSQSVNQVTLLAELDGSELDLLEPDQSVEKSEKFLAPRTASDTGTKVPAAWDAFLYRLREITVRR